MECKHNHTIWFAFKMPYERVEVKQCVECGKAIDIISDLYKIGEWEQIGRK